MNFYKGSSPRQEDIGSDRDVIRELHYKIFPQILETKNSQKNSYLSIIAPPQEGKSTLLLRFAKELVDKKQIVLWADATYKFAQENPFNELKLIRKCRKKRIFAIIDNIARLSRYSDFLQDLASQPNVKVTLIGTSRIGDWEKVKFEHPTGIEYLFENPDSKPRLPYKLKTTDSDIKAVVKKLREKGILKELKTPMSKPENFHILIWALAAPEGEENFSQRMLEEADSLTTLEKRVYCYVCALHRFGLPMPSPLIKRLLGKNIIGYLQTLVEKSVIRYIADDDSY
ncbi:MAG: AAA family ATPase, partial [Candidatus Aminicenantes bacterium]|nr:AAA family ATPase [Candidatus Aminicenantes bacterium]